MNEGSAPVGGGSVTGSKKARLVQWHSGGAAAAAVCSSWNPNLSAADFSLRSLRSPAAETCDARVRKRVGDVAFRSFARVRRVTLPVVPWPESLIAAFLSGFRCVKGGFFL